MLAYLARRLALSGVLLVCVVFLTFLLHHALPGDPAAAVLGKNFTVEKGEAMRERLGLNDPLPVQFARYLSSLAGGDLGRSHVSNERVTDELARVLPATIELGLLAVLIATLVGIGLGVFTALNPRTWWDVAGLTVALGGVSLPIFWLAFLAIQFFGVDGVVSSATDGAFGGLPLGGRFDAGVFPLGKWVAQTPGTTGFLLIDTLTVARNPEAFWHCVAHIVLPATVLASVPTAVIARITRAALGEVLLQDYIRTARAKGLTKARIVARHAMRNAAIPIVTSIGTQLGYLLGGAVLTETVFQWPGMGTYVVQAILNLDIKPLQGCVLVVAVGFVVVNLLVDLSYAWLDPRVDVST
jgi:peptide/nickel transport system permease protein